MPLDRVREQSFDEFVDTQRDRWSALYVHGPPISPLITSGARGRPIYLASRTRGTKGGRTMRSPRSSSVVTVFALVVSLLISLVLSVAALAEDKKVSGTGKFGPTLSQVILFPGDVPKHEVSLFNRLQTWNSADPDWNNVAVTQFVYSDYTAGAGYHRGHNANVHPSGDRTFISY